MNQRYPHIAILILASGAGRRFGGPKQLAMIDGEAMITRVIHVARGLTSAVVVVTGAHAEQVEETISTEEVHVVRNESWEEGMGSSIRTGVQYLEQNLPDITAVLITLTDMPHIGALDYERMLDISISAPTACIAAEYNDTKGVPAIFPRAFWHILTGLQGDRGARKYLRSDPDVIGVQIAAAALDIDRPEDLS